MDQMNSAAAIYSSANGSGLGNVTARIISAVPLSDEQLAELKAALTKNLNQSVAFELKVDPSVLGGLSIHAGSFFMDRTIKRQIRDMKDSVKRGIADDPEA